MYYYQFRMKGLPLNVFAFLLFLVGFFVVVGLCPTLTLSFSPSLFLLLLVWFVLHEIFHGLGFACFKEAKREHIVYGAKLEKGIFYCMCKHEISKANILVALLFPFFFLGIVTLSLGIWFSWPTLILLSILNISGAAGNLVMFFAILRMPKAIRYLDRDDPTSFVIVSPESLPCKKYFGLQLIGEGPYDPNQQVATNYQKLVLSNSSVYFLLGYFILIGLMFLVS